MQSVDLVLNWRPAGQNEQEGESAVFSDWYLPVEHRVQVNVLVKYFVRQQRFYKDTTLHFIYHG